MAIMMMTTTTTTTTMMMMIIIIIIIIMMMIIIIIIIIMIMMMMMMIIISFKGAIREFLQSSHCVANRLQHVRSSGPGAVVRKSHASHRALITCNMCYVPRSTKGQLSYLSLTELKSHLFLALFYWLTH